MAIDYPVSPVPSICISPAPYEEPIEEPKSPFACLSPVSANSDDYRNSLLSPPPGAHSPIRPSPLSPLRPADMPVKGQGIARERFEALLKASRERNTSVGARKPTDLRKEIALKAHKSKQTERRALFLSKLQAPPSPSATMTPKTPPESPTVLHYSLPSPGLNSPLAHFDMLAHQHGEVTKPWVEQVDFRLPEGERTRRVVPRRAAALPSLAEISARLSQQGNLPTIVPQETAPRRLPAFLQKPAAAAAAPVAVVEEEAAPKRPLLPIGRLRLPARSSAVVAEQASEAVLEQMKEPKQAFPMPRSPASPKSPNLKVTTTVVPRTSSTSPVDLTASNLEVFNARASKAKDMLSTLRRRAQVAPLDLSIGAPMLPQQQQMGEIEGERHMRRRSAPAELQVRERREFRHPVLALPGGF